MRPPFRAKKHNDKWIVVDIDGYNIHDSMSEEYAKVTADNLNEKFHNPHEPGKVMGDGMYFNRPIDKWENY